MVDSILGPAAGPNNSSISVGYLSSQTVSSAWKICSLPKRFSDDCSSSVGAREDPKAEPMPLPLPSYETVCALCMAMSGVGCRSSFMVTSLALRGEAKRDERGVVGYLSSQTVSSAWKICSLPKRFSDDCSSSVGAREYPKAEPMPLPLPSYETVCALCMAMSGVGCRSSFMVTSLALRGEAKRDERGVVGYLSSQTVSSAWEICSLPKRFSDDCSSSVGAREDPKAEPMPLPLPSYETVRALCMAMSGVGCRSSFMVTSLALRGEAKRNERGVVGYLSSQTVSSAWKICSLPKRFSDDCSSSVGAREDPKAEPMPLPLPSYETVCALCMAMSGVGCRSSFMVTSLALRGEAKRDERGVVGYLSSQTVSSAWKICSLPKRFSDDCSSSVGAREYPKAEPMPLPLPSYETVCALCMAMSGVGCRSSFMITSLALRGEAKRDERGVVGYLSSQTVSSAWKICSLPKRFSDDCSSSVGAREDPKAEPMPLPLPSYETVRALCMAMSGVGYRSSFMVSSDGATTLFLDRLSGGDGKREAVNLDGDSTTLVVGVPRLWAEIPASPLKPKPERWWLACRGRGCCAGRRATFPILPYDVAEEDCTLPRSNSSMRVEWPRANVP